MSDLSLGLKCKDGPEMSLLPEGSLTIVLADSMEISNAHSVRHRQIEHIHSFAIGCLDSRVGALLTNFEICSRFKALILV